MKKNIMLLLAVLFIGSLGRGNIAVAEELHNELFGRYDFVKNNYQEVNKLIAPKKVDEVSSISMSNNLEYLKFYMALLETRYLNEKFKNEQTAAALEKLEVSKAFLVKTMQEARLVE